MEFDFDPGYESNVNIKVVGVGGGGNNAVNRMIDAKIRGVDFIAINTDRQALNESRAAKKLVIGKNVTAGKGAGANPSVGRQSAEESAEEIKNLIKGADMLFITAGMGGGTGTGAAPIVAKLARDLEILTVAIVTKPFDFEGRRRMKQAEDGIEELTKFVDSIIVIPNERLKQIEGASLRADAAFEMADDVLRKGVQSVSDVINYPSFINLDFADVTAIMKNAGQAHMGVGQAKGEDKARLAATLATSSPLLSTRIDGATGVLISISAAPNIPIDELDLASSMVRNRAHPDANIIWGASFNEALENEILITVIATGFTNTNETVYQDSVSSSTSTTGDRMFSIDKSNRGFGYQDLGVRDTKTSAEPVITVSETVDVAPKTVSKVFEPTITEEYIPSTKQTSQPGNLEYVFPKVESTQYPETTPISTTVASVPVSTTVASAPVSTTVASAPVSQTYTPVSESPMHTGFIPQKKVEQTETPVHTATVVAEPVSVKTETAPTVTDDSGAKASCKEYEELFTCIRRIKKN
ncbi:MAG: cell division protein FtsZ [Ruminococcaceae bacterium]|nr:cell division protein FtsZ [Oscillospiraceae bacterium]